MNDTEPLPAARVPPCPACLGEEARKEWQRLSKELAGLGLLAGRDRAMLAAYCQAHALWVEAVASIGRYGTMVQSSPALRRRVAVLINNLNVEASAACPERLPAHAPQPMDRAGRALDRPGRLGRLRRSGRSRRSARPPLLRQPRPLATDVTALAWVFPPDEDDGLWHVLSRYFVPEEHLRKRAERDRVPYDLWSPQGFIEATSGNVVDYGAIEQQILADAALFQVREIAYDPGTPPTSHSASRTRGRPWSSSARALHGRAHPRTREADRLEEARPRRQPRHPLDGRQRRCRPGPRRQPQARQGQVHRPHRCIVALIMAIGRAILAQEEQFVATPMAIWV